MHCAHCGQPNVKGANYCTNCGAPVAVIAEDETAPLPVADQSDGEDAVVRVKAEELAPGSGMLIVRRGPNAGSKFFLGENVTDIGRHPASRIFLDDITVSRRHAVIRRESNGFLLEDVASLNGTYVNKERVVSAELKTGDEVQVGRFKLVFIGT